MRRIFEQLSQRAYAWEAGWAAWFFIAALWAFFLPWLAQILNANPDTIATVMVACVFLTMLLGLVIVWLMAVAMQPLQRRLLTPLVATALFCIVLILVQWGVSGPSLIGIDGGGLIRPFSLLPALLGVTLFAPVVALTIFFSEAYRDPLLWKYVLFFCVTLVTFFPVWVSSLTRRGTPRQRKWVMGLFLGYWAYAILGFIAAMALGQAALWH